MIGAIGHEDDIIGMGLAGVTLLEELEPTARSADIIAAYERIAGKADAIVMPVRIRAELEDAGIPLEAFIITIPEAGVDDEERLSQLAKEVLGITLQETQ